MTVQQAVGELVQEGILYREKGKGTFVCEPKVKQTDIMSFSEMVRRIGLKLEIEVLDFEKISTPEELAETIPFNFVYRIDRLRIVEGEVIGDEIVYIHEEYIKGIDKESLENSLYEILKREDI